MRKARMVLCLLIGCVIGNFISQLLFYPEPDYIIAAERSFFQVVITVGYAFIGAFK